ncbi:50S ribosomal protein L9 [Flavisolibacter tropicus]|uniref:Large ribosomal subunit protein bL9 n=1 Tax=Flavisolibacter tropicus TaxID=1492898 RepID=A0A172TU16_9BACT|nr:50S ribosomal protein L9 [Flavisolibacter tropicus]ANE50585.1 50S ribosomal protein L9 [Flavisolibacter tropicus]
MDIILIKDVDNLGGRNELVKVKNGYARNFLIPQGFAVEANPSNRKQLEERLKVAAKKEAAMLAQINSVVAKLQEGPVKIGAKTGTSGKIFGSVTPLQISRAIRDQKGYDIDRRKISITDDVKELGTYKASIDFGNGQTATVDFEVVGE